jgi:hypothetical protein
MPPWIVERQTHRKSGLWLVKVRVLIEAYI